MKAFLWILVFLMTGAPAWAARDKMTVKQLKDLLVSMQSGRKTDEEVSSRIKAIDLSEELTVAEKSNLMFASPGPLTSEQICVLEARSSILAPPSSDLPDLPAPDAATQKNILDKAFGVAAKIDRQIPGISASKTVAHYGHVNEFNRWGDRGGVKEGGIVKDEGDRSVLTRTSKYMENIEIDKGIEKVTGSSADPRLRHVSPWPEEGAKPALSLIMSKALESGNIHWLRWETINGTKIAVFSLVINKKNAPYTVDYCCFLSTNSLEVEWKPFKKTVGLHGELFIDPDTGIPLRIVLQAELSPTDYVEQDDTRVDYGTTAVDGKTYVVPVSSYTRSEVDAAGDSRSKGIITRMTLLVASYGNFRLTEAPKK